MFSSMDDNYKRNMIMSDGTNAKDCLMNEPEDCKTISDIPEEILEYILFKVSPYNDLKSAMLVCSAWYRVATAVLRKIHQNYLQNLTASRMTGSLFMPGAGTRITERYSHCACYYNKSMYVFGGCTSPDSTLNDLWRFDLGTREWIRPLAMGTYPFPKACASMVVYKDNLVLFGGWSHPTPTPLHQAARFFSDLHMYSVTANRWSQISTCATLNSVNPPPIAFHSASILGDQMVVFGGTELYDTRSNEIWVFDFEEVKWSKPRTNNVKPSPRYGQSQVTLDDHHILIIGGCGGPNQILHDAWLLTICPQKWLWEEVTVKNTEFAVPQTWCHQSCKVKNMVVFLSKPNKPPNCTPSSPRQVKVKRTRVWIPPREDMPHPSSSSDNQSESEEEQPENNQSHMAGVSHDHGHDQSDLHDLKTAGPRPGMPCIRPNAMKNRQRQLEALLKYERKLRQPGAHSSPNNPQAGPSNSFHENFSSRNGMSRNNAQLMMIHVLNISDVVKTKTVSWQPLRYSDSAEMPEETIFYTLVEGRGELILFGGINKDIQSIQRGFGIKSHLVTNRLYFLNPEMPQL